MLVHLRLCAFLTAFSLIGLICALPKKDISLNETNSGYYEKGVLEGTKINNLLDQNLHGDTEKAFELMWGVNKDVYDLLNILHKENSASSEHKEAFAKYRAYHRGLYDTFKSYEPTKAKKKSGEFQNAVLIRAQELLLKVTKNIADAPDFKTAYKEQLRQFKRVIPAFMRNIKPKTSKTPFVVDENAPEYQAGIRAGKAAIEHCSLLAQNKNANVASAQATAADLKKIVPGLLKGPRSPQYQDAYRKYKLYFAGAKKELEAASIEDIIKKYNASEKTAKKVRLTYAGALDSANTIVNSDNFFESSIAVSQKCVETAEKLGEEL